jgi:hypothetical protein
MLAFITLFSTTNTNTAKDSSKSNQRKGECTNQQKLIHDKVVTTPFQVEKQNMHVRHDESLNLIFVSKSR